ncbi:MAG: hypothetical protein ACTHQE_00380 [Thermomicrobiales bacterium]
MSQSISSPATQPWRRRVVQSALVLTLGGASILGGPVLAQDGSGGATPAPTAAPTCTVPTRTASGSATPATSRAATTAAASPAASPADGTPAAATPVATTTPSTSGESDAVLTKDLTQSATAIADCLTKGDFATLATITGDTYRGQLVGADEALSAEDFAAIAPSLAVIPYTIVDVADASSTSDGATATVTYRIGNQVRSGEWTFTTGSVGGKNVWVLDSETAKAVAKPAEAAESTVTIAKNAYTIKPDAFTGGEVFFSITNKDKVDHELFVVRLSDGAKVDVLLTTPGPGLPKGVTFVGQVTVPAGSDSELLLTDLAPGTYTVVDLLPNDQGLPNLSDGMSATFTVN